MPHPVGGNMGMTCVIAVKRGYTHFEMVTSSLNIHKTTSRWHLHGCCTLTSTADFCLLGCSTVLPKVFSRDLQVCQCIRTHKLM